MKVFDVMTSAVCTVDETTTLRQAAELMARLNTGTLPVLHGRHVAGIVTDGDIAKRAAGEGLLLEAPVTSAMTRDVYTCHAAEHAEDVLLDMQILEIQLMPVEDDHGQLVGMVSFGDLVTACPRHPRREDLRGFYVCMPDERRGGDAQFAA